MGKGKENTLLNTEVDDRTKEDVFRQIGELSLQYTPEWRFDRENPDAGTALAGVFADMFSKTLTQYNRVLAKNRIAAFNNLGAKVLPPVPAGGYAVFSMVPGVQEGAQIPAGMGVYADGADGEVAYKTMEDLYATPARIQEIYQVWDQQDTIYHVFTAEDKRAAFQLFGSGGENLQKHELYFSHDRALNIRGEADIELLLYVRGDMPLSQADVERLKDGNEAVFEYYSSEGWEILPVKAGTDKLTFHKNAYMPAFAPTEVEGVESFWIRCRLLNPSSFENFSFEQFFLTVKGNYVSPDVVMGNGIECNLTEYTPFGEQFGLYNEVYFACDEVLSKAGSKIELSFSMGFTRIPLSDRKDEEIDWNWVMKKSDFKVDAEYDLTIEEVLWEYYNGNGWCRLFPDNSYSDVFSPSKGVTAQYRTLTFTCPEDMIPVLVGSTESCYVRARIIKINNLYKNKGYYVTPMLSDTAFSYDFGRRLLKPGKIFTLNHLEMKECSAGVYGGGSQFPFERMDVREHTLYMGFDQPITSGPVKILFTMAENMLGGHPGLRWEYSQARGFSEANLVDETDGFTKSGVVTMMGSPDFSRKKLFGQELYWLRVVDEQHYFEREGAVSPRVQDIHMNAVRITNVDFSRTQYFTTDRYEENRNLTLRHPHVIAISLWVDEFGHMSERALAGLKGEREVECTYTPEGVLQNIWVKWDEVRDFVGTSGESRCYTVDRNEGVITFGNGRYGRIVPASKNENIRVVYRSGGGERANLPARSINRMEYSVGFVNGVTNPHRLLGGCDQETLEEAISRQAGLLRNHYRAVTAADFESLARCASRNIRRVQCHMGLDGAGRRCPGAMTLVVLQKDFEQGRYGFNELKEQIYRFMSDKIDGYLLASNRFFIVEPEFLAISVRMELVAMDFGVIFRMKKELEERLERFLNPISGHFDGGGWKIGTLPTMIQIQNLLRDVPGVKYIKNIYLTASVYGKGENNEVDMNQAVKHPFILPVSGSHSIMIRVEQ